MILYDAEMNTVYVHVDGLECDHKPGPRAWEAITQAEANDGSFAARSDVRTMNWPSDEPVPEGMFLFANLKEFLDSDLQVAQDYSFWALRAVKKNDQRMAARNRDTIPTKSK